MINLEDVLPDLWPHCPDPLMDGILGSAKAVFDKYEINTDLRIIHTFTQFSAETNGGVVTHESLFYTHADRLRAVWPSRFRHMSDAELAPYLRNEKTLANLVYGSRMGNEKNGTNDDDGYFYRGRGLLQCTGEDSYEFLAKVTGLDLIKDPDLIVKPEGALECAIAEFVYFAKALPDADNDNLLRVSGRINVGHPDVKPSQVVGYANRQAWYAKWKAAA